MTHSYQLFSSNDFGVGLYLFDQGFLKAHIDRRSSLLMRSMSGRTLPPFVWDGAGYNLASSVASSRSWGEARKARPSPPWPGPRSPCRGRPSSSSGDPPKVGGATRPAPTPTSASVRFPHGQPPVCSHRASFTPPCLVAVPVHLEAREQELYGRVSPGVANACPERFPARPDQSIRKADKSGRLAPDPVVGRNRIH